MHLLVFILYATAFAGLIANWSFFRINGIRSRYLVAVFALKLVAGIGLSILYTDHYENRRTGDAFRFYDDGAILHSSLEKSPEAFLRLMTGIGMETDSVALIYYNRMTHMQLAYYTGYPNDNATIIRANALTMFLSRGYYHVHTAVWCFMAMIGLTAIFKILIRYFPRKKWAMFLAVYLLPTVLFWSSGVLKEPILIMGIGLFLLGFFRWIYGEFSREDIAPTVLGLWLLLLTKGYVVQCMAPAMSFLILLKLTGGRKAWWCFAIPHALTLMLIFAGPYIANGLKVSELMNDRQRAFYNVAQQSNSGSVIEIPHVDSSLDVALNVPEAFVITYLRPWPWECRKLVYLPAALENCFLLICFGLLCWNFRLPHRYSLPIIGFSLSFVVIFGALAGQVVPILGALVRYKLPALIFLFALIFACTDDVLLQRRFPILRRWLKKMG